jgi:molecular chaperone IbpA
MRTAINFAPLYRSSVGFDRILDTLEAADRRGTPVDSWPPYDIVKMGEDDYRINLAVAGFTQDELSVTQEQNYLIVTGKKLGEAENREYLYQGITGRVFQRRFELADYVTVSDASLADGVLTIDLKRELPEEMKRRNIAISKGESLPKAAAAQSGTKRLAA